MWSPVSQKITALYFFSLVCASFLNKNVCKKLGGVCLQNEQQVATRRFTDFIVRENKRFLLFLVQQQIAESTAEFFLAYIFTQKGSANQRKKNTGLGLSINSETTCKNSVHLDEKKNRPKLDIEWLCSDIFNYVLVLAPKAIFSGNSSLPPFDKPTFLNSNLVRNLRDVPVCQCLSVFVTVEAWFTLVMELKAEAESEAERALQSCVNQKTES